MSMISFFLNNQLRIVQSQDFKYVLYHTHFYLINWYLTTFIVDLKSQHKYKNKTDRQTALADTVTIYVNRHLMTGTISNRKK